MLARIRKTVDQREEHEGGFTLIELLVVMIIIGILAAIAIPVFLNQRNSGYDASTKSDVKNASTAEETYFTDKNVYLAGSSSNASTAAMSISGLAGWSQSANTASVTITLVGTTGYKIIGVSKSNKSFCFNSTAAGGVVNGSVC